MSEQIVIREKFDGKDFSTWKFKMEMLLLDLDVWEVVEIPNDKTSEAKTEKGTMTYAKSFAKKNQKALFATSYCNHRFAHRFGLCNLSPRIGAIDYTAIFEAERGSYRAVKTR